MKISRRALLGSTGSLFVSGAFSQPILAAPRIHLRLLETSDLHMFVMDWDYFHAKNDPTVGLVKIADLVARARAEAPNSLLFDNGDILQGNPLSDYVARERGLAEGAAHPMFTAMHRIGYNVATLGNHEFNYGLDFLRRSLATSPFPFVCANLQALDGRNVLQPYRIIDKHVVAEDGSEHLLRIGVIGFVPPQIMLWDKSNLDGRVQCDGIVESAKRYLPELRANSDAVVALCHSGISAAPARGRDENASLYLAEIGGFDAIMAGHSHRVFPGPDYSGLRGVDLDRGTIAGVPTVMPGFWGSHLGVIDLVFAKEGEKWLIVNSASEAKPIYRRDKGAIVSLANADKSVVDAITTDHAATVEWVGRPVGQLDRRVHSYFVWCGFDPTSAIVNAAQIAYVKPLLVGTPHDGLPIFSAAAPFKAGYTPDAYIDIPAGQIALRDLADLYIYPNTVAAVRVTGATIREWLEHASRIFNRIDTSRNATQELIDRRVPSYNFDSIAGLSYSLDLSQPARTNFEGKIVAPDVHRVVDLRYLGEPLDLSREFVVVTNNYRADGGGSFPGLDGSNTIVRAPDTNLDAIIKFVSGGSNSMPSPHSPWTFAPLGHAVSVQFDSSPIGRECLPDVPSLRDAGNGNAGFSRYQFNLS